jgi:hypothetical protein
LPVSLHDGITGAVYVFDAYHNLILKPLPVSFELTPPSGADAEAHGDHPIRSGLDERWIRPARRARTNLSLASATCVEYQQ